MQKIKSNGNRTTGIFMLFFFYLGVLMIIDDFIGRFLKKEKKRIFVGFLFEFLNGNFLKFNKNNN